MCVCACVCVCVVHVCVVHAYNVYVWKKPFLCNTLVWLYVVTGRTCFFPRLLLHPESQGNSGRFFTAKPR